MRWNAAEKEKTLRAELEKTQRGVDQFLDRIADAQLPSVITVYENRIRKPRETRDLEPPFPPCPSRS
jgi:hypothetical protein